MDALFPVLAIEGDDAEAILLIAIEAAHVDVDSIGVRTRRGKRMVAAVTAKAMLGDAGVELVGLKVLFARGELEVFWSCLLYTSPSPRDS